MKVLVHDELRALRAETDSLDEEVIRVLGLKFIVTAEVGLMKAARCLDAVDPAPEAEQAKRYSALATRHGVSVEMIKKIFRTVIDEVVVNYQVVRENT